jgi:hypothetical protein
MRLLFITILSIFFTITGCSSTGSSQQTNTATNIVLQVDATQVEHVSITSLHDSFLNQNQTTELEGVIVEVTGRVVAFEMTNNQLYIVTIQEDEDDAICVFDASIADQIGHGRVIEHGATLTVRGQCYASGLFSSTPFTLDGCQIVQ